MKRDRDEIVKLISDMIDNPDETGIYHTSSVYNALEHLVSSARFETLGWAHIYFCYCMDQGIDPRLVEIPEVIDAMIRDFKK